MGIRDIEVKNIKDFAEVLRLAGGEVFEEMANHLDRIETWIWSTENSEILAKAKDLSIVLLTTTFEDHISACLFLKSIAENPEVKSWAERKGTVQ